MPQGIKNIYHFFVAIIAAVFFRFPAKNLIVIGVTGTDGKTTTVNLIYEILKNAGKKVAMISSVGAKIGDKDYDLPFHVTTPSSWQLQRFLRIVADEGNGGDEGYGGDKKERKKYLVLEVTSHALDQNRVWGIPFKIGVLTNITHEHLDYHVTYENYLKTKAKLFKGVEWAIINREDESYKNLKFEICNFKLTKILSYGLRDGDITPVKFSFHTPLPGEYNRYNCLAAIAAAKALRINDNKIREGIEEFTGVMGRFEFIECNKDFRVIIDFAHTPNALKQVLATVKPQVKGRLIHVFGCAGLRDVSKRPIMGKVALKYDDVMILTEEDYRMEDINQIMNQIESGVMEHGTCLPVGMAWNMEHLYRIPNRQEAINQAIKMAKAGDLVILTGKGHEKSLCRGKTEYPWSEHEAVERALKSDTKIL